MCSNPICCDDKENQSRFQYCILLFSNCYNNSANEQYFEFSLASIFSISLCKHKNKPKMNILANSNQNQSGRTCSFQLAYKCGSDNSFLSRVLLFITCRIINSRQHCLNDDAIMFPNCCQHFFLLPLSRTRKLIVWAVWSQSSYMHTLIHTHNFLFLVNFK